MILHNQGTYFSCFILLMIEGKATQIFIRESRLDYFFCVDLPDCGFYSKTTQRCLETGPLKSLLLWPRPWKH